MGVATFAQAQPTINCPAPQSINADGDCVVALPNYTGLAVVTGNGVTVTQSPAAGTPIDFGQTLVTLTATDNAGAKATCQMEVYVVDVTPPTITCPASATLNTDPNTCTAVAMFVCAVAPDNCSGSANPEQILGLPSGSAFTIGVNVIGFKATDASGNSASCTFTITVKDAEAPYLSCPVNIVKNTDLNQCSAITTWSAPTTQDNCGVPTLVQTAGPLNGSAFPKGTTVVAFKSTDAAGNMTTCSFSVTVNDNQAPSITCPASITVSNTVNQCGATVNYTTPSFSDNCPGATIVLVSGLPSGSFFPVGITTNVWKVTDAAGNMATCSFTVRVNDTQAPTFVSCPGTITKVNLPGVCGAVVTWPKITATDNCPGVVVTFVSGMASGSLFAVGTTTVIYKATDAAGNMATCSFNVIVVDNEDPTITCPANIVKANDFNKCSATIDYIGTAAAKDNCAVTSLSNNATGTVYPIGTTNVVWTAKDAAGNDATCLQTITVYDGQFPLLSCPEHIYTINDPNLPCQAAVDYEATASDNCPGVTIDYSEWPPSENGLYSIGNTTVMVTATDAAGNQVMCQFCIIVEPGQEICNGLDDDCDGYVDESDDAWRAVDKQVAGNGLNNDLYGASVAVSGGYAVVGAKNADGTAANTGVAYVLHNSDANPDNWEQVAVLNATDLEADDLFGASVAIHGSLIVVGAPQDDDQAANAGAAYIFAKDNTGNWNLAKKLKAADGFAGDNFGTVVSVNGDKVLVGASMNDEKGLNAGAAYLFGKDQGGAGNWGQIAKITAADGEAGDLFGASLRLDGDFAAIGAAFEDEKGQNAGAVYLFGKDQGSTNAWGQVKKITANDAAPLDNFGISVGLSGSVLMVGAHQNDDKGSNSGSAYIFERNLNGVNNSWGQAAKLLAIDGVSNDQLGFAVAVYGNYAVAGARYDNHKGTNSGSAYIWQRQNDGNWEYVSKIYDPQGDKNDQFGTVLDIYSRTVIVGSLRDDVAGKADQGSVSLFVAGCDDNKSQGGAADDVVIGGGGNTVSAFDVTTYPQPFSDVLNIEIDLKSADNARVSVWNAFGQQVASVYNGALQGHTILRWDAAGFASGSYFLRVEADNETAVKSILLVR